VVQMVAASGTPPHSGGQGGVSTRARSVSRLNAAVRRNHCRCATTCWARCRAAAASCPAAASPASPNIPATGAAAAAASPASPAIPATGAAAAAAAPGGLSHCSACGLESQ
jgi:hypothetical protein